MTTLPFLVDLGLVLILVALSLGAMLSRDLYRCVVFFMAFGLLMAFAWARLNAPDIALVEAAIGSGLTGALLLSTIKYLNTDNADGHSENEKPS